MHPPQPWCFESRLLFCATLVALALLVAAPAAGQGAEAGRSHRSRRHGPPLPPAVPPAADAPSTAEASAPSSDGSAQDAPPSDVGVNAQAPAHEDTASGAGETPPSDAVNPADAAIADPRTPALRLAFTASLGRVHEEEARDSAPFAGMALRVAYIGVKDLELALDGALQFYDRRYMTNQPGTTNGESLRVSVAETRLRAGFAVGFNVLGPAGVDEDVAAIAPYLRVELDQFRNDVVPQTVVGLGGGLDTFVRIADHVRIEGGCGYSYAVTTSPGEVAARLAFGTVLGALRYRGGVVLTLPPRAHLRVTYEGEWLALEHSSRFANGLSLGLDVDL